MAGRRRLERKTDDRRPVVTDDFIYDDPRQSFADSESDPVSSDTPEEAVPCALELQKKGARNVLVTMTHTDKEGNAKIKKQCTLPLTGAGVVTNIITELCVIDVTPEGLVLRELAPGVTAEEVQAKTEATLIIPDEIGSMF